MKKMALMLAVAVVAGCAAPSQGLRLTDLRSPTYFRGERTISMNFPKIQRALFKHQAACGTAPQFAMDPRQTNYATITDRPDGAQGYEQAVIVDLTQYQPNLMSEERARANIYSYYADNETKRRIEHVFAAIAHPEVCPGAENTGQTEESRKAD